MQHNGWKSTRKSTLRGPRRNCSWQRGVTRGWWTDRWAGRPGEEGGSPVSSKVVKAIGRGESSAVETPRARTRKEKEKVQTRQWQAREEKAAAPGAGLGQGVGERCSRQALGCQQAEGGLEKLVPSAEKRKGWYQGKPALGLPRAWAEVLSMSQALGELGPSMVWMIFSDNSRAKVGLQDCPAYLRRIFHDVGQHSRATRSRRALFPIPYMWEAELSQLRSLPSAFAVLSLVHAHPELKIHAWSYLSAVFCNGLWECSGRLKSGVPTKAQLQIKQNFQMAAARMLEGESPFFWGPEHILQDLLSKHLSYTGEEVTPMQVLTLEQVLPALPPIGHGGEIDLLPFVDDRTRHLLTHPAECLLADDGRVLPSLQAKVHVAQGEKLMLAQELVKRGIARWLPFEEVAEYRQQKVLSGLFGVGKGKYLPGGREILRLIMNLVPANSILKEIRAGVGRLPHITQWLSTYVGPDEELQLHQSDMSAAFYLFRLPDVWQTYMAFNLIVTADQIGLTNAAPTETSRKFALCCRVLPMGWASAVGVMQQVSERLMHIGGLPEERQVVRGRSLPTWMNDVCAAASKQRAAWWHIYLDNFCSAERVVLGEAGDESQALHQAAEASWEAHGVLSAPDKRVCGAHGSWEPTFQASKSGWEPTWNGSSRLAS